MPRLVSCHELLCLSMTGRDEQIVSPSVERCLAAILVADVVGYSKLIEADEASTLAALRTMRQKVMEPLLTEHRGRVVKLMGDRIIAEFGSVVSAVACAAAIQGRLAKAQEDIAPQRHIVLRIGVHLGYLVVEGEDLMGDGVNVAARLEQLCPPGGVLISSDYYPSSEPIQRPRDVGLAGSIRDVERAA